MKSFIAIPLILLVSSVYSFAKPKPLRIVVPFNRTNVYAQVDKSLEIGMTVIDFNETLDSHNNFSFKKGEKYTELLNSGLARKRKKFRDA